MGVPFLNDSILHLSLLIDTEFAQVNFLVCMLLTYPLAFFNRFIKDSNSRLLYGLITGLILQYQLYGFAIFHVCIATLNTYLFIKLFGRKYSSFYVLVFNIIHLSYLQIKVMLESYGSWSLGIEASYMMSICKFSSVAFNYEDGAVEESELRNSHFKAK
jgi:hypothetical protein